MQSIKMHIVTRFFIALLGGLGLLFLATPAAEPSTISKLLGLLFGLPFLLLIYWALRGNLRLDYVERWGKIERHPLMRALGCAVKLVLYLVLGLTIMWQLMSR